MTLWSDFTPEEAAAVSTAVVNACKDASGVVLPAAQQTALGTLFGTVVSGYAAGGVRCIWDPEDAVAGVVYAGRPILPDIVAILRNSTDETFVPTYGRKTTAGTLNKSGTEQVSIKPTAAATLGERIEVAVPDLRAASIGETETSDVDAAEKFRFDAEVEKSLYVLLGKWVRRASFPGDL